MSVHASGDGFAAHDSSLVHEPRCPECQFDHKTTVRRLPRSRALARRPCWLTLASVTGGSAALAALAMGAPLGALVVQLGALAAALAPTRWVIERSARRRR